MKGRHNELRSFAECECRGHAFVALTNGYVALVNREDVEILSQWNWYAKTFRPHVHVYAARSSGGNRATVFMHREILDDRADHINGNTTDNRRSNLRPCNHQQNGANSLKRGCFSSRFKGVYYSKTQNRWRAGIKVNNHNIYLGSFRDELEAARVYDRAAKIHFGEYAKTNAAQGLL